MRPARVLDAYRHLRIDGWTPPCGWGFLSDLPREQRAAAVTLAYLVCRVESTGPHEQLAFEGIHDDGQLAKALEAAGLIETYTITRWRRTQSADEHHRRLLAAEHQTTEEDR